ncbi:hypothetical protein [Oceanobacillus bengalensis]|uniref:Uncharacterized protein n=1 Tax=Oceanobacillus bengalensis TaxID=1435466 RepID=A0A494Z7S7_9BACI|nr:hypothetical protein [Oceanobacillus bengalensis]RKQ18662.1 hypothetical protein D8M05_00680 [Oceanobacillus bengalensis]
MIIFQKNIIGNVMFYGGIFIIIAGVFMAYKDATYVYDNFGGMDEPLFDWRFFFNTLIIPTLIGTMLIGLSEVIKLLDKLLRNVKLLQIAPTKSGQTSIQTETTSTPEAQDNWTMNQKDEEKIYDLYSDKAILEIIASTKKGYCIVKTQDMQGPLNPSLKVVDVTGVAAREVHDPVKEQAILASYHA